MGRNRIGVGTGVVGTVVLAVGLFMSGCASDPVPATSGSPSPRPTTSASPRPSSTPTQTPTPTSTPTSQPDPAAPGDGDASHDDEEHATHPPADPTLTANTAYASCVTAGRTALFTDDRAAAWQPFGDSYVERVDGVWRVHSRVTTTSAEGAGSETAAYCQVTGSESAPVTLTVGVTLAPPSDPGLWATPEG